MAWMRFHVMVQVPTPTPMVRDMPATPHLQAHVVVLSRKEPWHFRNNAGQT